MKQIVEEQLDELKVDIIQDPLIRLVTVHPDTFTPAEINTQIIPRVIARRFPDLTDSEANEVRHAVLLDLNFKNAVSPDPGDPNSKPNGELDVKRERAKTSSSSWEKKFVNLDDLVDRFDRQHQSVRARIRNSVGRTWTNTCFARFMATWLQRAFQ